MRLTFCFPGGKTKALTFSYDDGFAPDERLVGIFNRHAMKGTFNLNACRCGTPEEAEVLRKRYAGHEIACHGKTHPFFERMPQMSFVEDVLEDRRTLEKLTGGIIRSLGIVYSRTVKSTGRFGFPDDFLEWNPTCHHRENVMELADAFLASPYAALFYVWGHSFEFERNGNWHLMEELCAKLEGKPSVWYATNMEIYDYVTAFRRIVTSADSRIVRNPSAQSVWLLNERNEPVEVKGGSEISLE